MQRSQYHINRPPLMEFFLSPALSSSAPQLSASLPSHFVWVDNNVTKRKAGRDEDDYLQELRDEFGSTSKLFALDNEASEDLLRSGILYPDVGYNRDQQDYKLYDMDSSRDLGGFGGGLNDRSAAISMPASSRGMRNDNPNDDSDTRDENETTEMEEVEFDSMAYWNNDWEEESPEQPNQQTHVPIPEHHYWGAEWDDQFTARGETNLVLTTLKARRRLAMPH